MNPVERLEYFSFHIKTKKYENRKVVQFKQAKKIIKELSREIKLLKDISMHYQCKQ